MNVELTSSKIRQPKQQRSIEKKNRIIEAGFKAFCEKGYYKTNTAEIAKLAGVSTGIIYNYFTDKHDILLQGYEQYCENATSPILEEFKSLTLGFDLRSLLERIIDQSIEYHSTQKTAHNELEALVRLDPEVAELMYQYESKVIHQITEKVQNLYPELTHLHEKVHLSYHIIGNLCHELLNRPHECLDYTTMKQITVNAIIAILNS